MTKYAQVLLPLPFDKTFDYLIPDDLNLEIGEIILVPFGKKNLYGVVWDISDKAEVKDPKKIKSVIASVKNEHEFYKLSPMIIKLIEWQSDYTIGPKGTVLNLIYNGKFFKKVKERKPKIPKESSKKEPTKTKLSEEQKNAFHNIEKRLNDFSVTLLQGVTGSGKTEVYFEIIEKIIKQDKQVLIMLPEILLTTQMIKRFEQRFAFKAPLWHSTVSEAKRRKTFFDIANGNTKVVIGTRSSLHLPYKNLGLIIVDEEHDNSYKQEDQVVYNARDLAIVRAKMENIPIILSSATPSIETYYNAKTGKYHQENLLTRHNMAELPDVELIDVSADKLSAKEFISHKLRDEIQKNLEQQQQTLLFLNRRGYAPLTLCGKCGFRFKSPDTSAWMVMHIDSRGLPYLKCHHTGYSISMPLKCPQCEAENSFRPCGPGIQRLAEEVKNLFPTAKVMELASDITSSQEKMNEMIEKIESKQVDIIIGTQIIAKGHHFPSLSLVGIIDGDLGLDFADLRAAEKTFQLLHQVSGRAGREKHKGKVYIQTFQPKNKVMQTLLKNDLDEFLEYELNERKEAGLPPYTRLCAITVSAKTEAKANQYAKQLISKFNQHKEIKIYGPVPALYYEYRGNYRYKIMFKANKNFNIQNYIRSGLEKADINSNLKIKIDMDPYNMG